MKKKIVTVLALAAALLLAGCCLKHDWQEATCEEPSTCAKCGKTEGEALGHDWTDATCTAAETCRKCGETRGEPLAHKYAKATCTEPETCKDCGHTNGEPLGHKPGEWEVTEKATSNKNGTKTLSCTVCGEAVQTKTFTLESTSMLYDEDGKRLGTSAFADAILEKIILSRADGANIYTRYLSDSSTKSYGIYRSGTNAWTMMSFTLNGNTASGSGSFDQIMFMSYASTTDDVVDFCYNVSVTMLGVDPQFDSYEKALDVTLDLLDRGYDQAATKTIRGYTYTLYYTYFSGQYLLTYSIDIG